MFFGVKTFPAKVATLESAIVNVQAPAEFDVGDTRFKLETLSFAIVILVNVPNFLANLLQSKLC